MRKKVDRSHVADELLPGVSTALLQDLHLLTREAMALYLDKLAPGGLIALHISNRNLDLAPVVAALLADAGLAGRVQTQAPPLEAQRAYRNAATWVAIARSEAK